jgi:hypothetical protein
MSQLWRCVRVALVCVAVAVWLGALPSQAIDNSKPVPREVKVAECNHEHAHCAGGCGPLGQNCGDTCQQCHKSCNEKLTLCLVAAKKRPRVSTRRPPPAIKTP